MHAKGLLTRPEISSLLVQGFLVSPTRYGFLHLIVASEQLQTVERVQLDIFSEGLRVGSGKKSSPRSALIVCAGAMLTMMRMMKMMVAVLALHLLSTSNEMLTMLLPSGSAWLSSLWEVVLQMYSTPTGPTSPRTL